MASTRAQWRSCSSCRSRYDKSYASGGSLVLGLWGAWTLAHVVWYSKAPENYELIWGGMYRMRAPMIFLWTCVGVPIFITGLVLWVVRGGAIIEPGALWAIHRTRIDGGGIRHSSDPLISTIHPTRVGDPLPS
jgi:hypothetical protein